MIHVNRPVSYPCSCSQEDEIPSTSDQPESSSGRKAKLGEDVPFMVSDDIPGM